MFHRHQDGELSLFFQNRFVVIWLSGRDEYPATLCPRAVCRVPKALLESDSWLYYLHCEQRGPDEMQGMNEIPTFCLRAAVLHTLTFSMCLKRSSWKIVCTITNEFPAAMVGHASGEGLSQYFSETRRKKCKPHAPVLSRSRRTRTA